MDHVVGANRNSNAKHFFFQNIYGFETHLRDVFSIFLLISFQIKIMMICCFDPNKVSKSLIFCRR